MGAVETILIILGVMVVLFFLLKMFIRNDPNTFYRLHFPHQFISAKPKFIRLSDRDEGPPVRVITVKGGGADYVNAVGREEIDRMHDKYYKTVRFPGWLPNVHLKDLIDKFYDKPRSAYQTEFYWEMAPLIIKRAGEKTDEDVVKRLVYMDCMWESYIYIYLILKDKDHVPEALVNAFSRLGCTTGLVKNEYTKDGKTIIFHNFDWMTKGYEELPLCITYFEKFGVTQIGYAGTPFNVIAAYNKRGVWTNINNATYSLGFRINWNLPAISTSVFTLLKDANNAQELGKSLMTHNYDIACFYFGGDKKGLLAVVSDGLGTQRYEYTLNDDMYAVANKSVNLEWGNDADTFAFASDSDDRKRNMELLFTRFKGRINGKMMCRMAQEPLYMKNGQYGTGCTEYIRRHKNQDLTMCQMVYIPEDGVLYVRGQTPIPMNSPWHTFITVRDNPPH